MGDCDDTNSNVNRGAADYPAEGEIDGVDQNCDGIIDGGFTFPLPSTVSLNSTEGLSIGGFVNSAIESNSINQITGVADSYFRDGMLNALETALYANEELSRAIFVPTIEAGARVFAARNIDNRENINEMLANLRLMLDYVESVDMEIEQAYYDSLAEDNKIQFIQLGPDEEANEETTYNAQREHQTIIFRRLQAGADKETLKEVLTQAISQIEEATRFVTIEDLNETEVTE
jgi:hypothetical protein